MASSDPQKAAEKRYTNARKSRWFGEVLSKLRTMAGPGEPCMLCDANESTDIEHYRPKSIYPTLALTWENLLWACTACNRFKGDRFPPDTELGSQILNPVDDSVWDYFFIDQFGTLTPVWQPIMNAFDPRALSTRDVLRLDRETLQERRLQRLRSLRKSVEDTVARYRSGQITREEVRDRIKQWKMEPFQADVADYFLNGPGTKEEPFVTLWSLVSPRIRGLRPLLLSSPPWRRSVRRWKAWGSGS
ncbi:MAG: HNH endonuclease [Verrucomicrobiota bacterium]